MELGLGVYQAVSSDFRMTRFAGQIFEAKSTFFWSRKWSGWNLQPNETGFIDGRLSISLKGASRDLQGLYYDVPLEKSTTARPAFDARAGHLSTDVSYFQRFKTGKASFFFGLGLSLYQWAENKNSPLHSSDTNMTALVGLNYILGGSERPAVPQEDTSGLINTIRRKNEPF